MNKLIIPFTLLFAFILAIGIVSGQEQQTSGPYKWNKPVTLTQTCGNCTFVNITSINLPLNGTSFFTVPISMVKSDTLYTHTLTRTNELGWHIVNYKHDKDGRIDTGAWNYLVSTTGYDIPIALQFLFMGIIYFIIGLGVYKRDVTITLLGTIGLYFVGIWILIYGFNIYKTPITEAFAWVNLGVAFYLSAIMAYEYIQ